MSLRLSIEVDEPARVGETFAATVLVEATEERHIRSLSLELTGTHPFGGTDDGLVTFLAVTAELLGDTVIQPGSRSYRAEFEIFERAPPSMSGPTIGYTLTARAVIPWWFDVEAQRPVRVVQPPPEERPPPRRVTVVSDTRDDGQLFLELGLDDTTFAPGESITGAFSIANVGALRLDGATVAVVPRAAAVAGGLPGESMIFKSLVAAREGDVIRFSIPIPEDTAPSCSTTVGDIEREVRLRVDGSGVTVSIPITIGDHEPRAPGAGEPREAMGATRWRFTWRDEGARHGLALAGRELHLRGTLASEVSVKVKPRGLGIGATLRWKSFGAGFSVTKRHLVQLGGVELHAVDPAVAERFVVRGREEAQVHAAFEATLCRALLAFEEVELDDGGAKVSTSAPARDPAALRRFLDALDALARAVVEAEARLPAPAWVDAGALARWKAFASANGGRLRLGCMAITGAFVDGDQVSIETRADQRGEPSSTRVTLVLDPELEREAPASAWPELMALVKDRDPKPDMNITGQEMVLEMRGRTSDPESVRAAIAEMQRMARRLRGEVGRGPYR
jgi:hypothetical protein